jgi:hypothetical protein
MRYRTALRSAFKALEQAAFDYRSSPDAARLAGKA